jgi:SOS response associated peptidase (SRAP)
VAGIRAAGNGVELAQMRWSFPPPRPGGKPVFNFRSEGRRFKDSRRCLIPASAFFEFTGTKSPKTKHRFILAGRPFFYIAGVWRDGAAGEPPDFTILTTTPGPDVAPITIGKSLSFHRPTGPRGSIWRGWKKISCSRFPLARSRSRRCGRARRRSASSAATPAATGCRQDPPPGY